MFRRVGKPFCVPVQVHARSLGTPRAPCNTFFVPGVKGYDTKVMRKVISLRKRDKDDIAEEEAVLEMYKEALGMD